MKTSTYIVRIDGRYHAFGTDPLMDTIKDLETGRTRSGIRTIEDRDKAVKELTRPMYWDDARALAKASGNYIGQLYPGTFHIQENSF